MKELVDMNLPWKPIPCEGGYFLMVDISECADMIPDKYKNTHNYEDPNDPDPVHKYELYMPKTGKIPIDQAFCRWMAVEKKVVMMPNSYFYDKGSDNTVDKFVRIALCKTKESTAECV